jgi:hypothetical protein
VSVFIVTNVSRPAKNVIAIYDKRGRWPGQWIDKVHARRLPSGIVLDMESSVSPESFAKLTSPENRIASSCRRSRENKF